MFGNAGTNAAGVSGAAGAGFGNSGQAGLAGVGGTQGPVAGTGIDVCDADVYTGERKRLDIYMMVDDSGSMVPWWPATLEAISMFFYDPSSVGVGVGVQFFGSSCDAGYYATPRVPIAELPGNRTALENAFPLLPIEGTATLPAMEGAIMYARSWAGSNPDAKTVVLLVTDGLPDNCNSTVDNVTAVIQEGFQGSPSIQTFVIGLGDLGALNQFAVAGGTGQALVIQPGAAQELVAALASIRSSALPCEFALPAGDGSGPVDLDLVNLQYTDLGGTQMTIGGVADAAGCDAAQGGWYYDNNNGVTEIVACPQSCAQLNGGGEVQVVLGCPTVPLM